MASPLRMLFLIVVLLPLLLFGVKGEEKEYIVSMKGEISLFSDENDAPPFVVATESELEELLSLDLVEYYEENIEIELFGDFDLDHADWKWPYKMLNAQKAYDIGCTGQNVRVAVIDSGVFPHTDIAERIKPGYNFLNDTTDVTDNVGHGTFVAGMIAAKDRPYRLAGIAQGVDIVPLKCFDAQTSNLSFLLDAIYAAVDDFDCDVINLSLGTGSDSSYLRNAINYAYRNGVIIVAASGNATNGNDLKKVQYPAGYSNVIAVASVDAAGNRAPTSRYYDGVDIAAPGEGVFSVGIDGEYSKGSGTSFAAPVVAAAVAVMKNIDEDITVSRILYYLRNSAHDRGATGYDYEYGYGILDMESCIDLMLKDTKYFVSPIIANGSVNEVTIYNNTSSDFAGLAVWGNYTSYYMNDLSNEVVTIKAGKSVKSKSIFTNGIIKCFLWSGLKEMTVLSDIKKLTR